MMDLCLTSARPFFMSNHVNLDISRYIDIVIQGLVKTLSH